MYQLIVIYEINTLLEAINLETRFMKCCLRVLEFAYRYVVTLTYHPSN